MIAEVIVDLATQAIDKPFDYVVPNHLEAIVTPGVRVVVPFGPRKRLGFVTGVKTDSELDKLRPLYSVIDHTPVLTEELLDLGRWMADETLCFQISAFQAMLPVALKADYKKTIIVRNPEQLKASYPELQSVFPEDKGVDWDALQKQKKVPLAIIKSALAAGVLEETETVVGRGSVKKRKIVRAAVSKADLHVYLKNLGKRAPKQQKLLSYFLTAKNGAAIGLNELAAAVGTTPTTVKALVEKGILVETEEEFYRDVFLETAEKTEALTLTEDQKKAMDPIVEDIEAGRHRVHLCHGVTGSGKTEIYLQAIQRVIHDGRQAIVLVPEISLTPQIVERFRGRFGDKVAVLHSALNRGEKYDEWRKVHRGEVSVAVGARSAIFAPFTDLGLIIIDEEHETSYKQEETPRYHARDVAILRGRHHNCPVILGSATPALESYARAEKGRYCLSTMEQRANQKPLPAVELVDMREELREGNRTMFSVSLAEKLKERLANGEQSVLFLNRRGYSTFVLCRDCGHVLSCPHCDISLTYHRKYEQMKCHYCGYQERVPDACPQCASTHIRFFGSGTQKVEEALAQLVPEARVIRMDIDTTRKKGAHERLLKAFGRGDANILLGTQMIAKGLDFPNVTLVGVLAADAMLRLPDFRSAEKTFQLLTQVAGRAGRHKLGGEVVIQTYAPEHYAITLAANHDYSTFYQTEMMARKRRNYPPFYYLTLITVTHESYGKAFQVSEQIAKVLRNKLTEQTVVLGPVAPTIARVKDRYRCQCMIKYKNEPDLLTVLKQILDHYQSERIKDGLSLSIDVNPYSMM
ncbi:primosomal protein N' [Camelliibacillus cellulosilyticus]|uniref:Replication restart protein PriA n=1 Tax=Camelliibacillus cellulosilyticus TaxID=2174486 RepID=A0ABV9GJM3_9BACL